MAGMVDKYPSTNKYWEDKRADFSQVRPAMPCYIVASYSTGLHTVGSERAFEEIPSDKKWLTVHATQEWYDLYTKSRTDDLRAFFDHYLTDIRNNWEQIPRVRYFIINFSTSSTVNLPFSDLPWNLFTALQRHLFLSEAGKLLSTPPSEVLQMSYQADAPTKGLGSDLRELSFSFTFSRKTRLIGPATVTIHVAYANHDDMDAYVQLHKADAARNILQYSNIPLSDLGLDSVARVPNHNILKYLSPQGMLYASRRHVLEKLSRSSKSWKTLSHDREELVELGVVVHLDIHLWLTSIGFEAGEALVLKISRHYIVLPEFKVMPPYVNFNKGQHIVYARAEYDSHVSFFEI